MFVGVNIHPARSRMIIFLIGDEPLHFKIHVKITFLIYDLANHKQFIVDQYNVAWERDGVSLTMKPY